MEEIFITTPVRVEAEGDLRRPDGKEPAIVVRDASDQTVIRIPTPHAPGGRPHLEAMAFAGAQDICRQINEVDATLRAAVAEAGEEGVLEIGVTATRRSERVIGAWRYTLILPSSERVMVQVDPVSYDSDVSLAREAVRKAQGLLGRQTGRRQAAG